MSIFKFVIIIIIISKKVESVTLLFIILLLLMHYCISSILQFLLAKVEVILTILFTTE